MWPRLRRAMHWVGGSLGLAGAVFVVIRLREHAGQFDLASLGVGAWAGLGGLVVLHGLANILLALAWWHILRSTGASATPRWALRTYGVSQLAKYVPGNVLHLAARQGLGLAVGLPGRMLAKSLLWEIILLSITAVTFGILTLPLLWREGPILISVLIFISVMLFATISIRCWLGAELAKALVCHAGFLLMFGFGFVGTLGIIAGQEVVEFDLLLMYAGAYLVAWLAGFLTPGAPAGAGVREVVLVYVLGGIVVEADLLLAVAISRTITIAGDLGFFAWAMLARRGRLHG